MLLGQIRWGWVFGLLALAASSTVQAETVREVELRIFSMTWCHWCHVYSDALDERGWGREMNVIATEDSRTYRVVVRKVMIDRDGYPDSHRPRGRGYPESQLIIDGRVEAWRPGAFQRQNLDGLYQWVRDGLNTRLRR